MKFHSAVLMSAALGVSPALAQENRTGFSAGVALGFSTDLYIGDENDPALLPLLEYRGDRFSVGTRGASFTALSAETSKLDLVARPRFTALDDPDADELDGIDRDLTLDAGLQATYNFTDDLMISATLLQEVTGEHDGQEFIGEVENTVRLGPVPVRLGAGISWKSDDLSNYMFGVFSDEVRAGRPRYDLDATTTPFVSVSSGFPLSDRAMLIGGLRADFLGDEISDSPIVDEDQVISGVVGLTFSF
ncbi:MipA/OmpV family protein [Pseudaestuariivita rosea]|uniref:MipA/OmpV family protein n=1 Tax=Pseudaestuariivita rosea TaxID=2763263 RepID=UPI001ABAA56D|nr:MipA/OmpV family protein [Pseudaestuariivita rosea]